MNKSNFQLLYGGKQVHLFNAEEFQLRYWEKKLFGQDEQRCSERSGRYIDIKI